jgi:hypothetical protein
MACYHYRRGASPTPDQEEAHSCPKYLRRRDTLMPKTSD